MSDNPLIKTVILANRETKVPWPGVPGRLLPSEPFTVSVMDPFYAALLADRTLVEPPAPPAVDAPEPLSEPEPPEPVKPPGPKSKS